jgi:hypothetical protein
MSFDQNEDAIVGSLKQSLVCHFWSCYCYVWILENKMYNFLESIMYVYTVVYYLSSTCKVWSVVKDISILVYFIKGLAN